MVQTCSVFAAEQEKYQRMWRDVEAYRAVSFGSQLVGPFLALSGAKPGQRIVDVGCGTGRASVTFAELQLRPTLVDATIDALDPAARHLPFVESCLWRNWIDPIGEEHDFAYCCDVLEHIPPEFTMLVVERCLQAAPSAFLHINFEPDAFGRSIGEPLHLTVQPFTWWRDRLGELGTLTEARDLLGSGFFFLHRRTA